MHLPLDVWTTILSFALIVNAQANVSSMNVSLPLLPKNRTKLPAIFRQHSRSTPKFLNLTGSIANPQYLVEGHPIEANSSESNYAGSLAPRQSNTEDDTGTCAPGTPCSNGACCSKTGFCGYGPDYCGSDTCISNCDAQAQCGQYAPSGSKNCPLNVCCSKYGFCGSTEDFCGSGCQQGFGGCGEPERPYCSGVSASKRRIGYYESWSATRPCDAFEPEDLTLTGLTHINFAFAFFDPTSFEITSMDSNSGSIYSRFTALKAKQPGLKAWISVGGWSFNDDTNNPNTRTAFSDMASSSSNRQKFIQGLIRFMKTYSFDGVDVDWEYPSADDRGGRSYDTENFVSLVKDMRAAFGQDFGLSLTIPSSYWYLRWFDIKAMERYVDWFNFMSYDIHGVWDRTNVETGPYVRPHTNLTQISDGLDLVWRSGVSPSKIVMGLAYYGRSFTLEDPKCKSPGCLFSSGGKEGDCTKASGILSNAEINRIIDANGLTPTFDSTAAVNWISWDDDQWVSYDDSATLEIKASFANTRCLGGTMIWAIDQDDKQGHSASNTLGLRGTGRRFNVDLSLRQLQKAETDLNIYNQCYTSFCNEGCKAGFTAISLMTGQVGGVPFDTTCPYNGRFQTRQSLCCPGALQARCDWYGYQGEGMACKGGCPFGIEMARNTNQYRAFIGEGIMTSEEDWTCNGGSISYCCSFLSDPTSNPLQDVSLVDSSWEPLSHRDLQKRGLLTEDLRGSDVLALKGGMELDVSKYGGVTFDELLGEGAHLLYPGVPGTGPVQGFNTKYPPGAIDPPKVTSATPTSKTKGSPKTKTDSAGNRIYGSYTRVAFNKATTDCAVTYTCTYGVGFDEVCDNQRSGITEVRNGQTVYRRAAGGRVLKRSQTSWALRRNPNYRQWGRTTGAYSGGPKPRDWCEADEFPMGGLVEANKPGPQAVRQVDGVQNGQQGRDFQDWIYASFLPCSALLKRPPPITWAFDLQNVPADDARRTANGFIGKWGYDRMDPPDRCFARFTAGGRGVTVSDHGFRVLEEDNIFSGPTNWPKQDFSQDPLTVRANVLPTSVDSAGFVAKRDVYQTCSPEEFYEYLDADEADEAFYNYQLANAEDEEEYHAIKHAKEMYDRYGDTPPPPDPTQVSGDDGESHEETCPGSLCVADTAALPGSGVQVSGPDATHKANLVDR